MTTERYSTIETLDDKAALLVLESFVQEVRELFPGDEQDIVENETEARALLDCAAAMAEISPPVPDATTDDAAAGTIARALLKLADGDAAMSVALGAALECEFADRQMAVSELLTNPLLLAAAVTMLQTRIHFKVSRKNGVSAYSIDIDKKPADSTTVSAFVRSVVSRFSGG